MQGRDDWHTRVRQQELDDHKHDQTAVDGGDPLRHSSREREADTENCRDADQVANQETHRSRLPRLSRATEAL
jgi:hypothetical protein